MTKTIRSEIVIRATPEKTGKILADVENCPNWVPIIPFRKGNGWGRPQNRCQNPSLQGKRNGMQANGFDQN